MYFKSYLQGITVGLEVCKGMQETGPCPQGLSHVEIILKATQVQCWMKKVVTDVPLDA